MFSPNFAAHVETAWHNIKGPKKAPRLLFSSKLPPNPPASQITTPNSYAYKILTLTSNQISLPYHADICLYAVSDLPTYLPCLLFLLPLSEKERERERKKQQQIRWIIYQILQIIGFFRSSVPRSICLPASRTSGWPCRQVRRPRHLQGRPRGLWARVGQG